MFLHGVLDLDLYILLVHCTVCAQFAIFFFFAAGSSYLCWHFSYQLVSYAPKTAEFYLLHFYRGADKSLARPGRKQATATKLSNFLQATQKKKIRRLSIQPGLLGSNDLRVGRKMAIYQLFSISRFGLRTYQHPCRVGSAWHAHFSLLPNFLCYVSLFLVHFDTEGHHTLLDKEFCVNVLFSCPCLPMLTKFSLMLCY